MSKNVDEHVVEFQFNNSKFEKNIKQSQKSLSNFKESLSEKMDNNFVDQITDRLESFPNRLKTQFSDKISSLVLKPLDMVIESITKISSLINSMSFDQLSEGFTKFSQKTISIATLAGQTIKIAGKELTDYTEKMETVNDMVSKLNWFADATSYSLTDMTENVGKFTAAGVDLDTAVNSMIGISTWAAMAGQGTASATRAMYNLAQALGAGYVKLIDWISIQKANMDIQEFRATVLQTAVDLGELTKAGNEFITKTGKKFTQSQFTETLSEKWLTTDVLNTTLAAYAEGANEIYEKMEETGLSLTQVLSRYSSDFDEFGLKAFKAAQETRTFTQSIQATQDAVSSLYLNIFEKIFGSYDESKEVWSDMSDWLWDMFASGLDRVNSILEVWNKIGGREDLFGEDGAWYNMLETIKELKSLGTNVLGAILFDSSFESDAEVFNELGKNLRKFSKYLKEVTLTMKNAVKNSETLRTVLSGMSTILKIILTVIQATKYALRPLIDGALSRILERDSVLVAKGSDIIENHIIPLVEHFVDMCTDINDELDGFFISLEGIKNIGYSLVAIAKNLLKTTLDDCSGLLIIWNKIETKIANIVAKTKTWISTIKSGFGKIQNGNKSSSSSSSSGAQQMSNSYLKEGATVYSDISSSNSGVQKLSSTVQKLSSGGRGETYIDDAAESAEYGAVLLEKLNGLLVPLKSLSLALIDALTGVVNGLTGIAALIEAFGNKVYEIFIVLKENPGITLQEFVSKNSDIILGILQFATLLAYMTLVFGHIYKIIQTNQTITTGLNSLMRQWGLSQVLRYMSFTIKELSLLMISFSASMALLSGVDPNVILAGIVTLVVVSAVMIALGAILKNTTTGVTLTANRAKTLKSRKAGITAAYTESALKDVSKLLMTISGSLLGMAVAVTVLAVAIEIFEATTPDGKTNPLVNAAIILSTIVIGVALIMIGLSFLKKKKDDKNGVDQILKISALIASIAFALIAFAASLYILATVLNDDELSGQIWKCAIIMGVALVAIAALAAITTKITASRKFIEKSPLLNTIRSMSMVMTNLGIAMLTFASALWVMSKINLDEQGMAKMWQFFGMMVIILAVIAGLTILMEKYASDSYSGLFDKIQQTVLLFNAVSVLMTAMAGVISILSVLNTEDMLASVSAMTGAVSVILLMMALLIKSSNVKSGDVVNKFGVITAMIAMVMAIATLFAAMAFIDNPLGMLAVAGSVAMILFALAGAVVAMSLIENASKSAYTLIILSGALIILAAALAVFGVVEWEACIKGFISLSLLMATAIIVGKYGKKAAVGMLAMSGALVVLGAALILFNLVDWVAIGKMAMSLTLIVTAGLLGKQAGASLMVLAVSLAALAGAMYLFNYVSWESLAKGLLTVAAALAVAIVAALLGKQAAVGLMALAGGILVLAAAVALIVIAITKLMEAIAQADNDWINESDKIVETSTAFFSTLKSILEENKETITETIGILLEILLDSVGKALLTLVAAIAERLDRILDVVKTIIGTVLDWLIENVGPFTNKVCTIIELFLEELSKHATTLAYSLVDVLLKVLVGAIYALAGNLDSIVTAVLYLIDKLADTLITRAADIADSLYGLLKSVFGALVIMLFKLTWNAVENIAKKFGDGAAERAKKTGEDIINELKGVFGIASPSKVTEKMGDYLAQGLANGIDENTSVVDSIETIGGTIKDCWQNAMNSAETDGTLTIRPVVDTSGVEEGVSSINNMMSSVNGSSISTSLAGDTASEINAKNSRKLSIKSENQNGSSNTTNNNSTYNSTFYIESNDPEYIAEEVDKSLKKRNIQARLVKGY